MPSRSPTDHTYHHTRVTDRGLEDFAHLGASIVIETAQVDGDVSIRLIRFTPSNSEERLPFVVVGGLSTVVESFKGVLKGLSATHPVVYVETREKPSSHVKGNADFGPDGFAADVRAAVKACGYGPGGYALVGYSLGATAIMQGFAGISSKPLCVVLAEPVPEFRVPFWAPYLARVAVPVFPAVRAFAKWYLKTFRIDAKGDEEIVRIVERALDSADPVKLRNTVLAMAGRSTWKTLPGMDGPVLVVATSKDTLHVHADISRMGELLPDCEVIDMEDNTRSHSEEMAHVLIDYVERVAFQKKSAGEQGT